MDWARPESFLPHRAPFVWLDRIVALEPGVSAQASWALDPELPVFKGHFPGAPMLPGVILIEALAQTACALLSLSGELLPGEIGMLARVERMSFKAPALPGDEICLMARMGRGRSGVRYFDVEASRAGARIAHGALVCAIKR